MKDTEFYNSEYPPSNNNPQLCTEFNIFWNCFFQIRTEIGQLYLFALRSPTKLLLRLTLRVFFTQRYEQNVLLFVLYHSLPPSSKILLPEALYRRLVVKAGLGRAKTTVCSLCWELSDRAQFLSFIHTPWLETFFIGWSDMVTCCWIYCKVRINNKVPKKKN